jgi:tRNA(Ile)-lysidine synthase
LDCFREATKTYNLKAVIVAHTATDNVETILYNIMRGTSPRGMKGICSVSSWKDLLLLRPLLNIWRDDTARYCADNGLTPWVDSTNEDIYYARNLIRQEVMPLLRMINSRADSHILQIKNLVSQDSLYLDAEAEDLLRSCRYAEESLNLRKLLDIHNSRTNPSAGSITRRIIRDFLEEITGASLSAKDIDRCYRFVLDKGSLTKSNHIRGGYQLIKEDGLLICKKI